MRGLIGWVGCVVIGGLGCGDDLPASRPGADAAAEPGEPDATVLPAFGLATVYVRPGGEPAEGVPVLFQDADGEVVGEEVTDAEGKAALEIGRDSMVTLWLWDDLHTVAAVQPEDVVELWSPPYRFDSPVVGQVRVVGDPVDGATQYWLALGCEPLRGHGQISPSGFLPLRESCLEGDGTFDIAVAAVDADYNRLAFAYRTDVVPDADGTTRVRIEWEPDLPTVTFSYAGDRPVTRLFGELDAQRDGLAFIHDDATSDGSPVSVQHLAGFADSVRVRVAVQWEGGYSDLVESIATPIPASFEVTDEDLVPPLSAGEVDMSTPGRPVASWSGDTLGVDGIHIQLVAENESTGESTVWFAVVPPGTNEFRFPALSEALAPYGPAQGSVVREGSSWVAAMAADFADGYSVFRDRYLIGYWDSYHPDGYPLYSASHTTTGLQDAPR